jgi:hypothetical protein
VLAFVVELLNPSSLARDFIVARTLTRFVSSPAHSIFNLVVVPRVSKKSQESGEDGANSVVFTKCATKSSDILRDSNPIRQNYSVKEKIFNNRLPKNRRPLDDVNRSLSSCLRLSRQISQGK